MISIVEQTDLKVVNSTMINLCIVPKEQIIFYDVDEIKNMGKQLHTNIYLIDGFIFKIKKGVIENAYFPISYLKKYANLL